MFKGMPHTDKILELLGEDGQLCMLLVIMFNLNEKGIIPDFAVAIFISAISKPLGKTLNKMEMQNELNKILGDKGGDKR